MGVLFVKHPIFRRPQKATTRAKTLGLAARSGCVGQHTSMRRMRGLLILAVAVLVPLGTDAFEMRSSLLPTPQRALTDDGPGMDVSLGDDALIEGTPQRGHRELANRINETNLDCGFEKLGYCDYQKTQTNWLRNSGQTGQANTGPDGAYEGTWYAYTKAKGNSGKTYVITLPLGHAFRGWGYSFRYFMYGSQMGLGPSLFRLRLMGPPLLSGGSRLVKCRHVAATLGS